MARLVPIAEKRNGNTLSCCFRAALGGNVRAVASRESIAQPPTFGESTTMRVVVAPSLVDTGEHWEFCQLDVAAKYPRIVLIFSKFSL
jgi:hypothetical protein